METIINIIVVILAIIAVIILLPFVWQVILWILANIVWIAIICMVYVAATLAFGWLQKMYTFKTTARVAL